MPLARRPLAIALLLAAGPAAARAQTTATPASGTPAAAAAVLPALSAAEQIAAATLPLPAELRASATVLGHATPGAALGTLRQGAGSFVCLAPVPGAERFHAACYHRALEPFMARGRALRTAGTTGDRVDSVRFTEVRAGRLAMPTGPATLYSLTGPAAGYDAAANVARGARALVVVYIPGATEASTGLSTKPQENAPWLMFPGTPKAHIMFTPRM
jgi:hypothetical protein